MTCSKCGGPVIGDNFICDGCRIMDSEDDDINGFDQECPNCGETYDDIDYDYQICSACGFNNNTTQQDDGDDDAKDPNDSRNI